MKPDERVLQFLVNMSAAIAHIFGTEGERPINSWAWRFGSRSCQYALLAIFIALPVSFIIGQFLAVWALAWAGCWACQILVVIRRWLIAFGKARRGG